MKKLLFAVLVVLFFTAAFTGCNVYEHEEVEVIRCPVIDADTIHVPEWDERNPAVSNF